MYQTWGKRCTYIRFLTTKEDEELPTFVSDTKEAYMEIWGKTKEGFRRTYAEFSEEVDWVLKADDDTYVVLENLRYLLSAHNASEPVWFGCEFDVIVKDGGYMSGGAGYVLSRGSAQNFYSKYTRTYLRISTGIYWILIPSFERGCQSRCGGWPRRA